MKITFKKVNLESVVLQHNILLEATSMLVGREGVLNTEKELYLELAIVDALAEENIIAMCNESEKNLNELMEKDIEPALLGWLAEDADGLKRSFYEKLKYNLLEHEERIWKEQHSLMGMVESFLTMIGSMTEEDKKEALEKTGEVAKAVVEAQTKTMEEKSDKVASKLDELIAQFTQKDETQDNA